MEQTNFQFALPSIGTDAMSRNDQGALIVNQATAAIVSAYLKYAADVYDSTVNTGNLASNTIRGRIEEMLITASELTSLVDNVQSALRAF